jgi:hypothetical protein
MRLKIIGNSSSIAKAIDDFRQDYHEDYFEVREVAKEYLAYSN